VKIAAQIWAYTPPIGGRLNSGGFGPEWTARITISPVVRRPW
jgi:hypothetical protein